MKLKPNDKPRVKELLDLGVPKTKIAQRLGVTTNQLKYFIQQQGLLLNGSSK